MREKMYPLFLAFLFIGLWSTTLLSQTSSSAGFWEDVQESTFAKKDAERQIIPNVYRTVQINWETMNPVLAAAPMRFSTVAATQEVLITLPMPNGSIERFRIVEAPVLHEDLARRYPGIHAYAGQGIDDPTAYLRFDVTPQGFHAMVLSGHHSGVFIDPYAKGNIDHYISYYKKDFYKESDFVCHVEDVVQENLSEEAIPDANRNLLAGDCQLRTYRLALACTGEYAQFHGGTVAQTLAAMNTSMTRVNGVYERDAAITMVMIPNNDEIIFLNGGTDPYTNFNGGTMLGENQTTIDNTIGNSNYDIGHVYSTGGGGIASLRSPCNSGSKARGVTGLSSPVGDPFNIDYVAHEMGHQYGGNHTQNNNCNNVGGISVEPGSASTIMGYAGICNPNVQNNSDPYFHIINLREIASNVTNGSGSTCPETIDTGNNAPTADAGSNHTIPVSTPFALTGVATDADGLASLTYSWEQMDAEQGFTMPPSPTNAAGPAFRSLNPTTSPTRYFPNLEAVNNNTTPTWEVLPSVSRTMNFTFSVRDNNMGAGCVADDDVRLTVTDAAGPFLVLEPNTNVTWFVGDNQTIEWDVANTDNAPVSCVEVTLLLSTDGGLTYPVVLAENVPNIGSFDIIVPNHIGEKSRVKVGCADNVFYDISNTNFVIAEPLEPTFTMNVSPISQSVCANDNAEYQLSLTSLAGFDETTTFSVVDLPDGVVAEFTPTEITPSGVTTLSLSSLAAATGGTYTIKINANSTSISQAVEVNLQILESAPSITALDSPMDGESNLDQVPTLTWADLTEASEYVVEISTHPVFEGNIVETATVSTNAYNPQNLAALTVYYWRVQASNLCGVGNFSNYFAFQTGVPSCQTFESTDIPVDISIPNASTISSVLNIADDKIITDINVVNLNVEHTWVGDLFATLTAPDASSAVLFDRPGLPDIDEDFGCNGDNLVLSFDDDAAATAEDLEDICDNMPAIEGNFQPIESLSTFNGLSMQGDWTLSITDNADQDGGQLMSWALDICFEVPIIISPEVTQTQLTVEQGTTETVSTTFLQATSEGSEAADMVFTLTALPEHGTLMLDGVALGLGDTFTQADIDNNVLTYAQNGEAATADNFQYHVLDANNGWHPNNVFNIIILVNNLAVTATVVDDISCQGANDGSISVNATGGTMPYNYTIDGENVQTENVFTNLVAGGYIITVTDANGLSLASNEVEVSEPAAIEANTTVVLNTITVMASGGTGDYEYSIDEMNFQTEPTFSDLENGVYNVIVRDENDCEVSVMAIVAVEAVIASANLINGITCHDDNDASINVIVSGGAEPFQYSLDGENFQAEATFSNLPAGVYSVVVMDSNGQTTTTNEITVNNPEAIIAMATSDESTISVIASGGTGVLMYSINGVDFQIENVFSDLANGDYTITIMDENGCTMVTMTSVAVNTLVVNASVVETILCFGDATGVISVAVMGGTAPFQYSLDTENFQDSNTFEGLMAGTYQITVLDSEGFAQMTELLVLENPEMITATTSVANNTILVAAIGGTGTLTYSIDGMNFQDSNTFEDLPNGDYTITIMDENGCTMTMVEQVNIITAISPETTNISCDGAADGSITISMIEGGLAPYEYSLNGVDFQTSNTFSGLEASSYNLTVRDANGHEFTLVFILENPPALEITTNVDANTISISASGGTGSLQYSIDGGVSFQAVGTFTDLENGTYDIIVMDENGCQATDTAVIMVSNVHDLELDLFFNVQPNPTQGTFTLSLNQATAKDLNIQIIDALGRVVFEQQAIKTRLDFQETIHLQDVADGVYFLKVTDGILLGTKQVLLLR